MNNKEKRKLAISKLLLIALAIIGLGVVGWLSWLRPETDPAGPALAGRTQNQTSDAVTSEQQAGSEPAPAALTEAKEYLVIKEWQVRVPLAPDTFDMNYTFTTGDPESASFSFKRLQDAGICTPHAGVTMTRSQSEHQPPFAIDNPPVTAAAGGYYYYLAFAGEPCTTVATEAQKQIAAAINGSDITGAIKKALTQLEAAN